nr:hypothetical protein [Escherichia coli]
MFPAPAGINRIVDCYEYADERVPRASGDKPLRDQREQGKCECSPRQRG